MATVDLGISHLVDVERIGTGGFSSVYAATDTRFDRRVAVKVLRTTAGDEVTRQKFDQERRAMGRLSRHENVVTVFEGGYTDHGDAYLLMELVEGGSFADLLERRGPLPWRDAVALIRPVVAALGHAHQAGVIHRDVKPENILLDEGVPKVADFGIASVSDVSMRTSTRSLSPNHAPPEAFHGRTRRDERSDIYAVGSTLFTLITGHPPFWDVADDSPLVLMRRILHDEPPRLEGSLVPDGLDALVRRTLAKDPLDRPQTASELDAEIAAVIADPEGSPERAIASRRADPTVVVALTPGRLGPKPLDVPRNADAGPADGDEAPIRLRVPPSIPAGEGHDVDSGHERSAPAGTGAAVLSPPATGRDLDAVDDLGDSAVSVDDADRTPLGLVSTPRVDDRDLERTIYRRSRLRSVVLVTLLVALFGLSGAIAWLTTLGAAPSSSGEVAEQPPMVVDDAEPEAGVTASTAPASSFVCGSGDSFVQGGDLASSPPVTFTIDEPEPGSELVVGSTQRFAATIDYELVDRDVALLELEVRLATNEDGSCGVFDRIGRHAVEVVGGAGTQQLAAEVVVPADVTGLWFSVWLADADGDPLNRSVTQPAAVSFS